LRAAQLDSAERQLAIAGMDAPADLTEKISMAQADIEDIEAQIAFARHQLERYNHPRAGGRRGGFAKLQRGLGRLFRGRRSARYPERIRKSSSFTCPRSI
jgi:hypothetical protein